MTQELEMITFPDSNLRKGGSRVTKDELYSKEFMENISRMFSMMYYRNGIGLAAPQVGWNANVYVINIKGRPFHDTNSLFFVNPKIVPYGKPVADIEGCLSIPGVEARVYRPPRVVIEYDNLNDDYDRLRMEAGGLLARVIQHEQDHLNGELFIDRLSRKVKKKIKPALKQQMSNAIEARKKKLEKLKKKQEKESR